MTVLPFLRRDRHALHGEAPAVLDAFARHLNDKSGHTPYKLRNLLALNAAIEAARMIA